MDRVGVGVASSRVAVHCRRLDHAPRRDPARTCRAAAAPSAATRDDRRQRRRRRVHRRADPDVPGASHAVRIGIEDCNVAVAAARISLRVLGGRDRFHEQSYAVQAQASLGPDWCLVVVDDSGAPAVASAQVVYLDAAAHATLAGRFPELMRALPSTGPARKNVGYLFAVSQGAEAIWDFDEDHIAKAPGTIIVPGELEQVALDLPVAHESPVYNPYVKLGASADQPVWPRGLPLELTKGTASYSSRLRRVHLAGNRIALIQSVADHIPDLDAVYRLTHPLPLVFPTSPDTKPILVPARAFSPVNSRSCLFKYGAFFMLMLPNLHPRVADIWRGYAGQRLLWDVDLRVVFSPPLVDHYRDPPSYFGDLDAEYPLYARSGALIDRLRAWTGTAATLPGRIEQLYIDLYERGYIELTDVVTMQQWIKVLLDIGHRFPAISNATTDATILWDSAESASWPPLELFVPLPPTDGAFEEYSSRLHPSLAFFWPKRHLDIMFMTDAEASNIVEFSARILNLSTPIANSSRVAVNQPLFAATGHNRQQWLMLWADNFTSAEYIGFMDTDTVMSTRITRDDLYDEQGRPRVNAVYGEPYNGFWEAVPRSTFGATGLKEKIKAMTYFPVIIKREHLAVIRDRICEHMNIATFDVAFQAIVNQYGIYSQFNLMMNTLYYLRHDDYAWHIVERRVGWTGTPPSGQIESLEAAEFPVADRIPYPRMAVHWTWEQFGRLPEPQASAKFTEIMRVGYCYSTRSPATNQCKDLDVEDRVNPYEWLFEGDDYAGRPESIEAHKRRRAMQNNMPEPEWDRSLVAKVLGP